MGPVVGCGVAGLGPRAVGVEIAMPLELPQPLKAGPPDREVQENGVGPALVAGDAITRQTVVHVVHIFRRAMRMPRPAVQPHSIQKQRYVSGTFDVDCPPEVFSPVGCAVLFGRICGPAIYGVAAAAPSFALSLAPGIKGSSGDV